jgi:hypothetical protein
MKGEEPFPNCFGVGADLQAGRQPVAGLSLRPERSEEVPLGYPPVMEGEVKFAAIRCYVNTLIKSSRSDKRTKRPLTRILVCYVPSP